MRVQVAVAALLPKVPVAPGAQALQRLAGSHTDFLLELRRAGAEPERRAGVVAGRGGGVSAPGMRSLLRVLHGDTGAG